MLTQIIIRGVTMRLLINLLILCFLCFVTLQSPVEATTNKTIQLYLDGQKLETATVPIVMNNRVLLPIRTISEIFDIPLNWDPQTKSVKVILGDRQIEVTLYKKIASILHNSSTTDVLLDQPPVIVANRVFVPLRFMAEIFDTDIKWERETKKVMIRSPLIFKADKWYVQDFNYYTLIPINDYSKCIKIEDTTYVVYYTGDSTVGRGTMYALYQNGKAKRIFSDKIRDFQIEGDDFYYIQDQIGYFNMGSLMKVNINNPSEKTILGTEGYAYGSEIKLRKFDNSIYYSLKDNSDWQVRPDGIYIMAYDTKMALEDRVKDYNLLENTYGYYLVDKANSDQNLIENVVLRY